MNSSVFLRMLSAFAAGLASITGTLALPPAELQKILARGESVTLIDVRDTGTFQKAHLPGALNVPAALVPEKALPPLGRVVVYDDGLGSDAAAGAAAELNKKKGIRAEVLEGGFARWEELRGTTTRAAGVQFEELRYITYDQLKRVNFAETVLVDLRKPRSALQKSAQGSQPPLTDLQKEFPQARITSSPFRLPQARQSATGAASQSPLLVLIDDDGQTAQETARALRANNVRRVVILAGGEEVLARGGKPGLQRSTVTLDTQVLKK